MIKKIFISIPLLATICSLFMFFIIPTSRETNDSEYDMIIKEYDSYFFYSYERMMNRRHIPDPTSIKLGDTVYFTNGPSTLTALEPNEKGQLLSVKISPDTYGVVRGQSDPCPLDVYDNQGKFITAGTLTLTRILEIKNPQIVKHKARFYDDLWLQKRQIKWILCKKYKIDMLTMDSLLHMHYEAQFDTIPVIK
jgi:hypothetical protein